MAKTTKKIGRPASASIASIDPEKLADEVVSALRHHVTRLAVPAGLTTATTRKSDLRETIVALADYARTGKPPPRPIDDYLTDLNIIWQRAVGDTAPVMPPMEDPDIGDLDTWQGQITVVIRAAMCRDAIDIGRPVTPGDLGALAGYTTRNIRNLITAKTLVATNDGGRWQITAKSARAWLASLGRG